MSTQTINKAEIKNDTPVSVNLQELSEMSGVPLEFINKELLLDGENVSMENLREKMLGLLDKTFDK